MTITLKAPAGLVGTVTGRSGSTYTVGSDGTITGVANTDVLPLIQAGFLSFNSFVEKAVIRAPVVADLVSIVSAVTPTNVALTIAAQPPQARKLAIRVVIGTTTTTAITAGTVTLVGVDQDGNALSEVISLVMTASTTLKSTSAFAKLTSATVAGYVASGSGTGNTIGLGCAADFGLPTAPNVVDFVLLKATKITTTITGAVTGVAVVAADDVAATATVDATARTVAPTTAPSSGLIDFEFVYSYGVGG